MFEVEKFPVPPWRRRLLVLLLAVVTAGVIVRVLLIPPTPVPKAALPPVADMARCGAGQTQDCVGGTASVILAPASAPR